MPPDPSNTHVPNTSPDLFDPALSSESPIWPKPIGILSIVFGSLGLVCNGCGGVSLLAQPFLMSFGEEQFGPAPDVFKPLLGQVVLLPIALILSIVLLFAGIMLLGRKPASRTLHLLYAWLSVPLAVAGTYFGYKQITRLVEWKSANPSNGWASQVDPNVQLTFLVVGVFIGLAWPLFVLVWFGLIKRNASDMGTAREVL